MRELALEFKQEPQLELAVQRRAQPVGWDGHVAAFIMNADRWGAGTALMQAGNPEAWRGLMDDFNFVKSIPLVIVKK